MSAKPRCKPYRARSIFITKKVIDTLKPFVFALLAGSFSLGGYLIIAALVLGLSGCTREVRIPTPYAIPTPCPLPIPPPPVRSGDLVLDVVGILERSEALEATLRACKGVSDGE